ncbi:endonuclease domain-containing protein, partial [Mycobacterium sp. NAZ190054]|uniref:endonuclease domain-containing protein n=1 Tax=Mycobacterium sp. NAZ190054 TaxID=1747766 RepID=UPI000797B773
IAGLAAAALHGAPWVDADIPIEVTGVKSRPQRGLIIRADAVDDDEIVRRAGLPVTSRIRTAFDLGRLLLRGEALARLDALMWNQRFSIDEVAELADRRPRAHGVGQLRDLLPLVDGGAASLQESRIRLWLLDCGFPRPQTQIPILEGTRPVAFLDMGWPDYKVAVEYDGDHHRKNREQYVKDIARARMLEERGWIVIRVIAEDRPAQWLARTESALASRGCRVTATEMQRFVRTLAA